jgi:hypothetical protein
MKILEIEFEGKGEVLGTNFKQIEKSEKAFLYELTDKETGTKHFEVFERKIQKAGDITVAGVVVKHEEKEMYPKSNSFGKWAWCMTCFEKAKAKFNEISK